MADVLSGDVSVADVLSEDVFVLVLSHEESAALAGLMEDYAYQARQSGDSNYAKQQRLNVWQLRELFDGLGVLDYLQEMEA